MGENTAGVETCRQAMENLSVLRVLREGPRTPRDLRDELDISRSTVHRVTSRLQEHALVRRCPRGYELTPLGEVAVGEIERSVDTIETASHLVPILDAMREAETDVRFDVREFRDATVTVPTPGDPYRPVRRLSGLVQSTETTTLDGFDRTTLVSVFLDVFLERVVDGASSTFVFPRSVVASLLDDYEEQLRRAVRTGGFDLYVREGLPLSLTLFDDRVAIGGYTDDDQLRVLVDTDAKRPLETARALFESYRETATPLDDFGDFAAAD